MDNEKSQTKPLCSQSQVSRVIPKAWTPERCPCCDDILDIERRCGTDYAQSGEAYPEVQEVWKFYIGVNDRVTVHMPRGAKLLTIQTQGDEPHIWALCDPRAPLESRIFRTFGTGHPIPGDVRNYVGSYPHSGGALVLHVFEVTA